MKRIRGTPIRRAREPELELDVTYAARRPWVPKRSEFAVWARAALSASGPPTRLSVRVVGTARSRQLNRDYRGKPKSTNVLSFAGAGPCPDDRLDLGELVICAPVVAREAEKAGVAPRAHWAHLTVHGVLHLRGFDHEHDPEARKMMAKEVQILELLGFSDPYA